jgi:transposase
MLNDVPENADRGVPKTKRRQLAEGPRQRYSPDFKLKVLKETFAPGASVAAVALRHNMNTNVVFRWRRQHREGQLGGGARLSARKALAPAFVSVGVVDRAGVLALPAPQEKENAVMCSPAPADPGVIEIETALGTKLRLTGNVNERMLRLVLAEIRRRR